MASAIRRDHNKLDVAHSGRPDYACLIPKLPPRFSPFDQFSHGYLQPPISAWSAILLDACVDRDRSWVSIGSLGQSGGGNGGRRGRDHFQPQWKLDRCQSGDESGDHRLEQFFDWIGADDDVCPAFSCFGDLTSYRISRAIAAASAVPLLLSPITLKNYRGEPGVIGPDMLPREATDDGSRRNLLVENVFRSYGDYHENPYIHLVDGWASDNLGLEALIDADLEFGGMERLIEHTLHEGPPRRFAVIVVNASVHHSIRWSQTPAVPGVASELWRVADEFGEHNDAEFLDLLRVVLNRWKTDSAARLKYPGVQPEYYLISVDLDELRGKADGSFFESLPTNFHLSSSTVDRVVGAGESLLKESSEFQRLLSDLGSSP